MRYSRPFVSDLVVGYYVVTVIFLVKFEVLTVKEIFRERNALFRRVVSDILEFGEHGLTIKGGSYHIHIIRTEIFFKRLAFGVFKQILQKQHFVYRTCYFRYENLVIALRFRLSGV